VPKLTSSAFGNPVSEINTRPIAGWRLVVDESIAGHTSHFEAVPRRIAGPVRFVFEIRAQWELNLTVRRFAGGFPSQNGMPGGWP